MRCTANSAVRGRGFWHEAMVAVGAHGYFPQQIYFAVGAFHNFDSVAPVAAESVSFAFGSSSRYASATASPADVISYS